ncbi:MAG: hypothetical protein ACREKG_15690 [Candidatus Rokuibacteriota bacterium]
MVKYPDAPRLESLRRYVGTLSDAFVHYTPEFAAGHDWRTEMRGDGGCLELPYLTVDQRVIEEQLLLLGGIHVNALDLFDECFEHHFAKDAGWARTRVDVERRAAALAQAMPPRESAPEGDKTSSRKSTDQAGAGDGPAGRGE